MPRKGRVEWMMVNGESKAIILPSETISLTYEASPRNGPPVSGVFACAIIIASSDCIIPTKSS